LIHKIVFVHTYTALQTETLFYKYCNEIYVELVNRNNNIVTCQIAVTVALLIRIVQFIVFIDAANTIPAVRGDFPQPRAVLSVSDSVS